MKNSWVHVRAAALIAAFSILVLKAQDATDAALLERVAAELEIAAPPAPVNDVAAYASASKKLADSKLLASVSNDTIVWGGHAAGKSFKPQDNAVTEFDPRVWRAEYLAEFMFSAKHSIQRNDDYSVLTLECTFRNALDPGDYPYPFWHSIKKWQSYQRAKALHLVFEKGKLIAAYRSAEEDLSRPIVDRTFDGNWHWSGPKHAVEPHISLYENVFSKDNPHVAALETAYRKMELASRQSNCMTCHSPANPSHAKKQLLLNYPNQALAARLTLIKQLESDLMPPGDNEKGVRAGINDPAKKARMIELAKAFVDAANQAVDFETERLQKN